jgi:hypothetical protein
MFQIALIGWWWMDEFGRFNLITLKRGMRKECYYNKSNECSKLSLSVELFCCLFGLGGTCTVSCSSVNFGGTEQNIIAEKEKERTVLLPPPPTYKLHQVQPPLLLLILSVGS